MRAAPAQVGRGHERLHFGRLDLAKPGAVSSVGRAPARQAGGHWFEPSTAHKSVVRMSRAHARGGDPQSVSIRIFQSALTTGETFLVHRHPELFGNRIDVANVQVNER